MSLGLFTFYSKRRRSQAFTLVEIMVVVVIIGLLAAAALPTYRRITMRSKGTTVVNDLRTFSTAFITYNLQNGRWPADGDPQVVPSEVASQLPTNFIRRTPIGGYYKWNFSVPADGITAKAAIIIQAASGNPIIDDLEQIEMIDQLIDDGNTSTGNLQLGSTNSVVYIIER
ncbi:MAG: prepilin-type N-terminal cleavage/methylation domain-containing protein [Lacunisphaera sp.]|nr:prepilin-type N-terminal cleavage/methylation domain-containing protein [Lacunisphaera sp.]